MDLRTRGGGRVSWDKVREWHGHIYTTKCKIDHILGHKSSLSKFKKVEIISSIFSDHNVMRLEINYREKS